MTDNEKAITDLLKQAVESPRDGIYWKLNTKLDELETFLRYDIEGAYPPDEDAEDDALDPNVAC